MLPEIIIAGSGNVAAQLSPALHNAGYRLSVCSTNADTGKALADSIGVPFYLPEATPGTFDLAIIATQDDNVERAAQLLTGKAAMMVHTSGTLSSYILKPYAKSYGVFYPLQTIRKEIRTDWETVPVCIYSNSLALTHLMEEIADRISSATYYIDDEQRRHLHVAAVLINNFTHHLAVKAKAYAENHGIDFKILHSLVSKTAENVISNPDLSLFQTGPASRGDINTIDRHLQMIRDSGDEELAKLYELLSKSIMKSRSV